MSIQVVAGAKNRGRLPFRKYLDRENLPTRSGVYLARGTLYQDMFEIDVYTYPKKGLCCFSEDFGSGGTGVNDESDCHVSIQCTGLEFIMWLGNSTGGIC
jgi:hypothetical protein